MINFFRSHAAIVTFVTKFSTRTSWCKQNINARPHDQTVSMLPKEI